MKKRKDDQEAFASVGKVSKENKMQFVETTLQNFSVALAEFAAKHKKRINADPEFRQQFHIMCSEIVLI